MRTTKSKYIGLTIAVFFCGACQIDTYNYYGSESLVTEEQAMLIAKGEFEVKMLPVEGQSVLTLDKTYQGELSAVGKGDMLASRSSVVGSASYVAIETVSGELNGWQGSFVLVHRGVMQGENQELSVTISPDSGTDELEGISGSMNITIIEGKHFYVLEFELP